MSEELNEQIINTDESLESETDGVEFTDTSENAEATSKTKNVSDRINKIRADAEAKIEENNRIYREEIDKINARLREYQANEKGITVDELIAQETAEADKISQAVENDPRFQAAMQRDFERQKLETLKSIQDAYPEENLESIEGLPEDFYKQLQIGIDPVKAYRNSVISERPETPPSSGSVKSTGTDNDKGRYYTADEVSAMSREEVHAKWDDILKSKAKW